MRIDPRLCVGCGNCVAVCPMQAIALDPATGRARIDRDACVECYTCYRGMSTERLHPGLVRATRKLLGVFRLRFEPEPDVCPTSAIVPEDLEWPRTVRRAFSDVQASHEETGIQGRGTEEVKTNDVTDRVRRGEIGFVVELGRPGVGADFRDIQRVTRGLADRDVRFEKENPVTGLMTNTSTGDLDPEVLGERVMSAIVEFKVETSRVDEILTLLPELARELDTVMAAAVSVRCDERGENPVESVLRRHGFPVGRAKTNLGLGRLDA